MDISTYLIIGLTAIAVSLILYFVINHKHNVNHTLRAAAKILNTKVRNSLINGSYVTGSYKNREITFATVIQPPKGADIMFKTWMINRVVQISTRANIQPVPGQITQPTTNTYLDGNKVIYNFPEVKADFIGTKSGQSYEEADLPGILDELIQAAEIVEKSASKVA